MRLRMSGQVDGLPSQVDEIATVRLANTELQRARRYAGIASATPSRDLGWLAVITKHAGNLSDALVTGDNDAAVLAIRQMQADLEALKREIAA